MTFIPERKPEMTQVAVSIVRDKVNPKDMVFWVMRPCILVDVY
jgi:hypothetical protein